jgi:hypothetical protein
VRIVAGDDDDDVGLISRPTEKPIGGVPLHVHVGRIAEHRDGALGQTLTKRPIGKLPGVGRR